MEGIKPMNASQCVHCRKLFVRPKNAIKHLGLCKKNPDNKRACMECSHLDSDEFWVTNRDGDEEKRTVLFCSKLNFGVYPFNIKEPYDLTDNDMENKPMPKECEHFTDEIIDDFPS